MSIKLLSTIIHNFEMIERIPYLRNISRIIIRLKIWVAGCMASLGEGDYRRVSGHGCSKWQILLDFWQQVCCLLALLTIAHQTEYCSRDSWFLNIRGVQESDAGKYICQLNTERPISISGTLSVVGNHKTQSYQEKLLNYFFIVWTCHLMLLIVVIICSEFIMVLWNFKLVF